MTCSRADIKRIVDYLIQADLDLNVGMFPAS